MAKKIVAKKTPAVKAAARSKAKNVPKAKAVQAKVVKAKPAPVKPAVAVKGFSKTELARFKQLIIEKRKEILEELETLKASMMDVQTGEYVTENSTYSLHMEQGTDTMEREKTFLFASREGKFLNYLDDALKRIEKGEYGFCLDCGSLIDKERLEAVPHAQLCIKCKLKRGR
ncbi:MAG: TraR/DksA C4-type zinc finger protein [Ignavibacteriales bacterium]|nr:TraR/DksA C4-type zinc finger protein [Ignavibacteriales bacterium]